MSENKNYAEESLVCHEHYTQLAIFWHVYPEQAGIEPHKGDLVDEMCDCAKAMMFNEVW